MQAYRLLASSCAGLAVAAGLVAGCAPADGGTPIDAESTSTDAAGPAASSAGRADPTGTPSPAATAGTPVSQTSSFVPTRLTLPSGDVAAVDPAGVSPDGVLQVPDDASRVGWWTGGALAGEPYGGVVIAGHVDSRQYGLGVLSELLSVQIGEQIVLENGADVRRYEVSAIRQAPKARLEADTEAFRQDVDNRLVLITCVGAYDHVAHAYPDNLVVFADEME